MESPPVTKNATSDNGPCYGAASLAGKPRGLARNLCGEHHGAGVPVCLSICGRDVHLAEDLNAGDIFGRLDQNSQPCQGTASSIEYLAAYNRLPKNLSDACRQGERSIDRPECRRRSTIARAEILMKRGARER